MEWKAELAEKELLTDFEMAKIVLRPRIPLVVRVSTPTKLANQANEIRRKGTKPHHCQSIFLKTPRMTIPNHPLNIGKMVPKSMELMRRNPLQEKKA
jgi:hypothetical protein